MLVELRVSGLGVIDEVSVALGPGTTALTGETGTGKTLLVDAIELLLGAPADPQLVRPGAGEAVVEGRFLTGPAGSDGVSAGNETVVARVIPAAGRSRSYLDGRMAAASQLAELGAALVDLHGQHAHHALLAPAAQRGALDRAGGISTAELAEARRRARELVAAERALGGDQRTRAREMDLARYELAELDGARLEDPEEDAALQEEEELLSDATALREASTAVWEGLIGEEGVVDRLGLLTGRAAGHRLLDALRGRLRALGAELADAAGEARAVAESAEEDPERLAAVTARRQLLSELRRKYGDSLAEVIAYRDATRARLAELESHDVRAAALGAERAEAEAAAADAAARLRELRRRAAPALAAAVEEKLRELAMPHARFEVEVDDVPPGDAVTWKLGANPGEPVLPLSKAASGGELARTMLAARLVTGGGSSGKGDDGGDAEPPTLIFDEVDAGIGGEAAVAVGRALAALGTRHQVLVVTHLPQVAAFADRHLVVRKRVDGGRTVAEVVEVTGADRVVELSRMLSGSPDSETARRHAEELLARGGTSARGPAPGAPTPPAASDGPAAPEARTAARGRPAG